MAKKTKQTKKTKKTDEVVITDIIETYFIENGEEKLKREFYSGDKKLSEEIK